MSADVDIDFGDRIKVLELIKHISATKKDNTKHNSGVYIQSIPIEPFTGYANIDYETADDRGYFKLDILNVGIYKNIKSPEHYEKLLNTEPPWHRLNDSAFVERIIHLSNYVEEVGNAMPDTIPRLAMFIATIRPAKQYLLGKTWKEIGAEIWVKPDGAKYFFKKAHAISYGKLVALHMNIVNELDFTN